MRGVWSHSAVGWVIAVSLLPVIAAVALDLGMPMIGRIVLCGVTVAVWQSVFRVGLGVPLTPTGAVTAVAVAMLAPTETPLWQIILAVSFGTVIGELIFGGWGRGFLSAATVSLAFLSLSQPTATYQAFGPDIAWAVLPAALILLLSGILALPVVAASMAGFAAIAVTSSLDASTLASLGGLAFVLVYLIGDPVTSAATPLGRWIYGGLAGALTALLMSSDVSATQSVIFAALLAAIFAPLIDQGVIAAQLRLRKGRHG